VSAGNYEAKLTDVELLLSDGSIIRADEIEVPLRFGATGLASPAADFQAYYQDGVLSIRTPQSEQIAIYSVNGSLLYKANKAAGESSFNVSALPRGVLIVRGSSGWVKKIVKF
jgi:hypothetical protein